MQHFAMTNCAIMLVIIVAWSLACLLLRVYACVLSISMAVRSQHGRTGVATAAVVIASDHQYRCCRCGPFSGGLACAASVWDPILIYHSVLLSIHSVAFLMTVCQHIVCERIFRVGVWAEN